ncbi:MAG: hypothetical protein GXO78_01295 [Calditrichaeota bacterium]|nr:hypothetical protein [Calditrichota bacterium]
MRIILEIKDNKEGRAFMKFLKQLPFVKVELTQKQNRKRKKKKIEELFGIWKDRDITEEKLREKAWKM